MSCFGYDPWMCICIFSLILFCSYSTRGPEEEAKRARATPWRHLHLRRVIWFTLEHVRAKSSVLRLEKKWHFSVSASDICLSYISGPEVPVGSESGCWKPFFAWENLIVSAACWVVTYCMVVFTSKIWWYEKHTGIFDVLLFSRCCHLFKMISLSMIRGKISTQLSSFQHRIWVPGK